MNHRIFEVQPEEAQEDRMSRTDKTVAWVLGVAVVGALAIGVGDKAAECVDGITNPSYSDIDVLGD